MQTDIRLLTSSQLLDAVVELGEKPFRAKQLEEKKRFRGPIAGIIYIIVFSSTY